MQTQCYTPLLVLLLLLTVGVRSTAVSECVIGTGKLPEAVDLPNCDQQPCHFFLNATSSIIMKFKSPRYMENFQPNALAVALGLNVPYPLGQDDGCVGVTNTPCPLAENEYIEYSYSFFILPIFPKIGFTLEFSLIDMDNNNEQFECFRVDIQLDEVS